MYWRIIYNCSKVGMGISWMNADSQWNPVYKAFHRIRSFWKRNDLFMLQPIPFGMTFSKALSKLKAQSSNVSFYWNMAKETFELWASSFETAFENVTPSEIGCNINVILTRQTCGQRSNMASKSKRRALVLYFSVRICYMFWISICRGESELGLYMTSRLAKRMRLHSGHFWFKNLFGCKIRRKPPLHSRILFASHAQT